MKKGFLPIAILMSALVLTGCGGKKKTKPVDPTSPAASTSEPVAPTSEPVEPTSSPVAPTSSPVAPTSSPVAPTSSVEPDVFTVEISNKEDLQAEWHVGEADRKVEVELTKNGEKISTPAALAEGELVIESDSEAITAIGQKLHVVEAGKATITVSFKGLTDTVEVEATQKQTNKERFGTEHEGNEEDPFDNEDALIVAKALEKEDFAPFAEPVFIKGVVASFYHEPGSGNKGDKTVCSWFFEPAQKGGEKFEAYIVYKDADKTEWTADDLWQGATVTIKTTTFAVYNSQYETASGKSYLVKVEGEKPEIHTYEVNVAGAIEEGRKLDHQGTTADHYKVTGYVVKADGNNFFMADTKEVAANDYDMFEIYKAPAADVEKLLKNAKVTVECTLKRYGSTLETAQIENGNIFEITLLEAGEPWVEPEQPSYVVVDEPVVATSYKLGVATKGSDLKSDYFSLGTVNSSGYGLTTKYFTEGVDFQLVEVEGGYNLKIVGDTVQYVNFVANGTGKAKLEISETATSVFTYNADAKTLVSVVDEVEFYMGTYTSKGSTFNTLSVSKLDYISGDNASKIDVSQFPAHFWEEGEEPTPTPTPSETPAAADHELVETPVKEVSYKIGLATEGSDLGKDLFFAAELNEKGFGLTVESVFEAPDFQLVEVEGGYNLKIVGETVQYVNFVANGTEKAKLEISETATSVFTYNADAKTLVSKVADIDFYMGTYTSKGSTYNTLSVSKLSYISGDNASKIDVSQFPAHFYLPVGEPPVEPTEPVEPTPTEVTPTEPVEPTPTEVTPTEGGGGEEQQATTVEFSKEELAAASPIAKNGVTLTNTSDYGTTVVTELRIYKGKSLTVAVEAGKAIKSIAMTCTATGTAKQGPGCFGAGAPEGYTFEADGKNGTWTGSAESVVFTATDNQVRIAGLVVIYE